MIAMKVLLFHCLSLSSLSLATAVVLSRDTARHRHHVVVCNGFADPLPALVSEQLTWPSRAPPPTPETVRGGRGEAGAQKLALLQTALRPVLPNGHAASFRLAPPPGLRPATPTLHPLHRRLRIRPKAVHEFGRHRAKVVWTRTLGFGQCEEYYTDLQSRKLAFMSPDRSSECTFEPTQHQLEEAQEFGPSRLVLVMAQQSVRSTACLVRALVLPPSDEDQSIDSSGDRAVRLATLDAFAPTSPLEDDDGGGEVVDVSTFEDGGEDLESLPALDTGAELKLEDEIEPDVIAAEVIATRTLGLNGLYSVEPRKFLMALEDIQGTTVWDKTHMDFKKGNTYIAIRTGRAGDVRYPQQLVVYTCQQQPPEV